MLFLPLCGCQRTIRVQQRVSNKDVSLQLYEVQTANPKRHLWMLRRGGASVVNPRNGWTSTSLIIHVHSNEVVPTPTKQQSHIIPSTTSFSSSFARASQLDPCSLAPVSHWPPGPGPPGPGPPNGSRGFRRLRGRWPPWPGRRRAPAGWPWPAPRSRWASRRGMAEGRGMDAEGWADRVVRGGWRSMDRSHGG